MENSEAYGKVIDILMSGTVDYKSMGIALAKTSPEGFLMLYEGVSRPESQEMQIEKQLKEFIIANPGRKVEAIKLCRSLNGMGLKEAKDYVEYLEPIAHIPSVLSGKHYGAESFTDLLKAKVASGRYLDEGDF